MKKILMILMFISSLSFGQKIGKLATEKPPEIFPSNSWGVDIMFGDGGFGLGSFFRKSLSRNLTGFIDFAISESKDEREVEYVDYFGNTYTIGKENRVFMIPINMGVQYRLFAESVTDNLRPYISLGTGPSIIITTPYKHEFFKSFSYAESKIAFGGYIGFGANFGLSKSNLIGLNFRYYIIHLFDEGVENMTGKFRKTLHHFYLSLNLGIMY